MLAFREQQGAELARSCSFWAAVPGVNPWPSVSCTAFILLEMMQRSDQDPWPALATLSDYFCRADSRHPRLRTAPTSPSREFLGKPDAGGKRARDRQPAPHDHPVFDGTSGLFLPSRNFHTQLPAGSSSWEKKGRKHPKRISLRVRLPITRISTAISPGGKKTLLNYLEGMISSEEGRRLLGKYLGQRVSGSLPGNYDPHYSYRAWFGAMGSKRILE
jgi:hypothetical protein